MLEGALFEDYDSNVHIGTMEGSTYKIQKFSY